MAKTKNWNTEVEKLKKDVKELQDILNKTSIFDEYGCIMLNTVRFKKDIEDIIKRHEDLIIHGPFRPEEK